MAELIDKMQNIMCESCTSCEANWCDGEDKAECQWMQKIAEVGTTTKAEIRARAIDEFAEKMGRLCENSAMALDRYDGRPLYNKDGKWHDLINDMAEQLKEE